jgi:DNA polymerase-3 subunit epsilon
VPHRIAFLRNLWLRYRFRFAALAPAARRNLEVPARLRFTAPARSCGYVVVDMETTGFDPGRDGVVSIGALRVAEGRIRLGDVFYELVDPGRPIPPSSIRIHGIIPGMVAGARTFGEVFDDFLDYLGPDVVVAHHAAFDLGFLNGAMREKYGFELQNLVLDTVPMCREILFRPGLRYPFGIDLDSRRYSLDNVAKVLGIAISRRHSALGDALATAMILQRVLSRLERGGSGLLRDLAKVARVL